MKKLLVVSSLVLVSGCANATRPPSVAADVEGPRSGSAPIEPLPAPAPPSERPEDGASRADGPWIGAAAESALLDLSRREAWVGVWVDVPEDPPGTRPPAHVALVIDTSGSMQGAKLESAREAAAQLVRSLHDGDVVSVDSFADDGRVELPPTRVSSATRGEISRRVQELRASGATNMFAGLSLAERHLAMADATIRRVFLVSDGKANRGPTSPETLGLLAERGLDHRAQITSLGVGLDYDERTLDAIAVRSSGRLHHVAEPREMASVVAREVELLERTVASDARIDVVAAPGVEVLGADGARADVRPSGLSLPIGALSAGQHREALIRVRVADPTRFAGTSRPLVSVRLRFRDAREGDLERVQEVVARAAVSSDPAAVARSAEPRTQAIAALRDAARRQLAASEHVNDGRFAEAEQKLDEAARALEARAQATKDAPAKKRLEAAAAQVASARAATRVLPSAPKDTQRDGALKLNAEGMREMGY